MAAAGRGERGVMRTRVNCCEGEEGRCLQLLSPNDADKRLRASGGEEAAQMHCWDGTLDAGAVVRLRVIVRTDDGGDDDSSTPASAAVACAGSDELFGGSSCGRRGRGRGRDSDGKQQQHEQQRRGW